MKNKSYFWLLSTHLLLLVLVTFTHAMQIVESPPEVVWVKSQEELQLNCTVNEPWMWCYWEVTKSWDQSRERYAMAKGSYIPVIPDVAFVVTNDTCGLKMATANAMQHDGQWKCHVADTDKSNATKVAEAFTTVNVATEATLDFTWRTVNGSSSHWADVHQLHDVIYMQCFITPQKPEPQMSLWLVDTENNRELLVNSSDKYSDGYRIEYMFEVTRNDDGSRFVCDLVQEMPDTGERLFASESSTEQLNLVYPPMLEVENHPPYIFTNASIIIPLVFLSKPMPDKSDVLWTIQEGSLTEQLYPDQETDQFQTLPLESTDYDNEYVATVIVKNVSQDVGITVNLRNEYGDLSHSFVVTYLPHLPEYPEELEDGVQESGIPLWIILVIVGVVLLLLILMMFGICATRSRNTNQVDLYPHPTERPIIKSGNGQPVDLDAIPDHHLPLFMDQYKNATGVDPHLHRSFSQDPDIDNEDSQDDSVEEPVTPVQPELSNGGMGNNIRTRQPVQQQQKVSKQQRMVDSFASDEFNENLLDVQSHPDPDPLSSFLPIEPGLVLKRAPAKAPRVRIPDKESKDRPPIYDQHGNMVRLSGATQYPVVSPPPKNYIPPPSVPGRKTTLLHFMEPEK